MVCKNENGTDAIMKELNGCQKKPLPIRESP